SYYTAEPVAVAAGGACAARKPGTGTDGVYHAVSDLLTNVQSAWTAGDLAQLKRYVTPEMLSYFSEELSRNASQGVENKVENVRLLKGDLLQAWREDRFEYATARLTWSAADYTVPTASGRGGQ